MNQLSLAGLALSCAFAMPAWAQQETPFKDRAEAAVYRGSIVFHHYCVLCHGAKADGEGRAAKMYTPRPANLARSDKSDAYKTMMIRRGGGAMGRSAYMPPWGDELSDEQVTDVVAYLRSITLGSVSKPDDAR
jgi:mono/diheme cytochrome c family protein